MISHYQAKLYEDMVAVRDVYCDMGDDRVRAGEYASDENRCALHLTRYSSDVEMSFALELAERLPKVHRMLSEGVIDLRRARVIDHETCHLSVAAARGVVERIAEAALVMTTGELRARIKKLCIEADPHEAEDRYQRAVTDRKLIAEPTLDGTANLLGLDLAPDRVAGISRRINAIAKSLLRDGETRTMDQLRADVYLDLLQGAGHKTNGRAVVHLTADLDTLAGLAEHPGDLNGFAPVIADIARQVAADNEVGEWRFTITDTETGRHLHDGITRRRPTVSQRRHIESRDRMCVFPGCRMPSTDCDIDHTIPYSEGGATCPCNTAPACRHDHRLKDQGWTYKRLPDGRYQWKSPLGHTYTTWKPPP
ncbi:MAG: HNH endonuclease signature motif containing protein [Acidimicrobiia bacterium]|nr:MAG: HNH endonuclease signature motif containing protein [Acidimicrobiia bacterium]